MTYKQPAHLFDNIPEYNIPLLMCKLKYVSIASLPHLSTDKYFITVRPIQILMNNKHGHLW